MLISISGQVYYVDIGKGIAALCMIIGVIGLLFNRFSKPAVQKTTPIAQKAEKVQHLEHIPDAYEPFTTAKPAVQGYKGGFRQESVHSKGELISPLESDRFYKSLRSSWKSTGDYEAHMRREAYLQEAESVRIAVLLGDIKDE